MKGDDDLRKLAPMEGATLRVLIKCDEEDCGAIVGRIEDVQGAALLIVARARPKVHLDVAKEVGGQNVPWFTLEYRVVDRDITGAWPGVVDLSEWTTVDCKRHLLGPIERAEIVAKLDKARRSRKPSKIRAHLRIANI